MATKSKKRKTRKRAGSAATTGRGAQRDSTTGRWLPGNHNGGRKPGSLDGIVACRRFLSGKLNLMCVPGGAFDRMIERRMRTNDGMEWLWLNVFARFVDKLPATAGATLIQFNVSVGPDRVFPPGMDGSRPMLEQGKG